MCRTVCFSFALSLPRLGVCVVCVAGCGAVECARTTRRSRKQNCEQSSRRGGRGEIEADRQTGAICGNASECTERLRRLWCVLGYAAAAAASAVKIEPEKRQTLTRACLAPRAGGATEGETTRREKHRQTKLTLYIHVIAASCLPSRAFAPPSDVVSVVFVRFASLAHNPRAPSPACPFLRHVVRVERPPPCRRPDRADRAGADCRLRPDPRGQTPIGSVERGAETNTNGDTQREATPGSAIDEERRGDRGVGARVIGCIACTVLSFPRSPSFVRGVLLSSLISSRRRMVSGRQTRG